MRETLRDPSRLRHMIDSIHNVNQYMDGKNISDLTGNSMLFFAVVKNIEIVGEAAYKLTHEFKENHPETPWRQIIAMRHILVHGYYQVTSSEIYNVYKKAFQPWQAPMPAGLPASAAARRPALPPPP